MDLATKTPPHLPSELWSHVFSYLTVLCDGKNSNDAQTLYNLCLVSHRFYEIAQSPLYATIRIDITSHQASLLRRTLQTKPHFALAVKEISIECNSDYYGLELRHFLQELLQSMQNLYLFRSNHRGCTTKLIESILYKEGSSYTMDAPTDLFNLRSLELLAHDLVFKYNYILRLPQLERVVLNSVETVDPDNEDFTLPDDWGWTSSSIKELVLRLALPGICAQRSNTRLRSRSLSALSNSMPRLETLAIEHFDEVTTPSLIRRTASFFLPQLERFLHRLELHDGSPGPENTILDVLPDLDVEKTLFASIVASTLEQFTVDAHLLFHGESSGLFDHQHLPKSIRRLNLRYVDTWDSGMTRNNTSDKHKIWINHVRLQCPVLKEIFLELHLYELSNGGFNTLNFADLKEEFRAIGISFYIMEHRHSTQHIGSITCSMLFSKPMIRRP